MIYTCVSQRTATHCNTLQDSQMSLPWCLYSGEHDTQCVAVCCSVLQCVAVCCSVLQCVAVCCSVLQYVAGVSMIYSDLHMCFATHSQLSLPRCLYSSESDSRESCLPESYSHIPTIHMAPP